MLVHTLAPSLGLGLGRAGLGSGCATRGGAVDLWSCFIFDPLKLPRKFDLAE